MLLAMHHLICFFKFSSKKCFLYCIPAGRRFCITASSILLMVFLRCWQFFDVFSSHHAFLHLYSRHYLFFYNFLWTADSHKVIRHIVVVFSSNPVLLQILSHESLLNTFHIPTQLPSPLFREPTIKKQHIQNCNLGMDIVLDISH